MSSQHRTNHSLRRESSINMEKSGNHSPSMPSTPTTPNRVRFENIPEVKTKQRRRSSHRSTSGTEPTFMSPLSFEEIDVKNTPLSSMRSCSEYQRQLSERNGNTTLGKQPSNKSFWSSLFPFGFTSPTSNSIVPSSSSSAKKKVKLSEVDADESQFLVERLRFNQANLYEGEDYNYSKPTTKLGEDTDGGGGSQFCFSTSGVTEESGDYKAHYHRHRTFDAKTSIFGESTMAFDYLFGLKLVQPHLPMEIELKHLSAPKYYDTVEANGRGVEGILQTERREDTVPATTEFGTASGIRRIPSLRNLDRSGPGIINNLDTGIRSRATSNSDHPSMDLIDGTTQIILLKIIFKDKWEHIIAFLKRLFPSTRGDELFYESIRMQPFASGAYLRCMLLAGLSSTFFQIYNVATWPSVSERSTYGYWMELFLYLTLLFQAFVNLFQLPFRLRIHFLCWESSRALEVDVAITIIRNMLQSESWLINKALGKIIDGMIVFNLIMTELYLWFTPKEDSLRGLLISLCATNMLTVVARVLVATIFSFSMHDPQVLSEARKRGLSKWDLEVLPTFVYSKPEEVNNSDCPICLCSFDMGEMLISLPCDAKHSFHAACIRQWLQRQNSCPLCQKMV